MNEGLDIAVASVRVRNLCYPLGQFTDQVIEVAALHPFIAPELEAASAGVAEAAEALERAMDALKAKMEVELRA